MPRELSLAEIFQLGYYWETKILLTAVKLDLFSSLNGSPRSSSQLAQDHALTDRPLALLLNALVAMRVLKKEADVYMNTEVAQRYLVKSQEEYVGHLLLLHDAEWENWGKLEETIRTGRSPVSRHVFETDPDMGVNVLSVLHRIGRESGPSLAKRMQLDGANSLLDVGGGAGTNAIACCQEYPELTATVFDLPSTLKMTEAVIRKVGLESRIRTLAGNFHVDDFKGPYDAALMSDILHYQDGEVNATLVAKIFQSLSPGGQLVIKDRFLDPSGTSPAWTTAFAVHIMVNTEQGQCFTTQEAMRWLRDAGFRDVHELEPCAVVQGRKPMEGGI
ncbi:MAG: acetylserotonin O-methyltransferase [Nitrospirales bacterium]|nr:methyltransferase domain-containing protein [Nitrospira sp.]MDR4500126.1 acetylserotonin O-methyltransferase [Nitrospirales bacterium]